MIKLLKLENLIRKTMKIQKKLVKVHWALQFFEYFLGSLKGISCCSLGSCTERTVWKLQGWDETEVCCCCCRVVGVIAILLKIN